MVLKKPSTYLILCINITKKTLFLAYKILIFDACQSLTAKYTTNYNYINPCNCLACDRPALLYECTYVFSLIVSHGHLYTGQLCRHFIFRQVDIMGAVPWDPNYTPGVDFLDRDFL
jgi:hypothetical protein